MVTDLFSTIFVLSAAINNAIKQFLSYPRTEMVSFAAPCIKQETLPVARVSTLSNTSTNYYAVENVNAESKPR